MLILIGLIAVLFIVFAGVLYWITRPQPTTGNYVLDTIRNYQNWKYDSPTISKPYVFQLTGPNTIQINYFDDAGYMQGFAVLQATYRVISPTIISMNITSIIANPSKRPIPPDWQLQYVNTTYLKLTRGSESFVLRMI